MQNKLEDFNNNIQSTSVDSFKQIIPKISSRQNQIMYILRTYGSLCNREICEIARLPINSVTPRVKELRDLNLVVKKDVKKDIVTDRNVIVWGIK